MHKSTDSPVLAVGHEPDQAWVMDIYRRLPTDSILTLKIEVVSSFANTMSAQLRLDKDAGL